LFHTLRPWGCRYADQSIDKVDLYELLRAFFQTCEWQANILQGLLMAGKKNVENCPCKETRSDDDHLRDMSWPDYKACWESDKASKCSCVMQEVETELKRIPEATFFYKCITLQPKESILWSIANIQDEILEGIDHLTEHGGASAFIDMGEHVNASSLDTHITDLQSMTNDTEFMSLLQEAEGNPDNQHITVPKYISKAAFFSFFMKLMPYLPTEHPGHTEGGGEHEQYQHESAGPGGKKGKCERSPNVLVDHLEGHERGRMIVWRLAQKEFVYDAWVYLMAGGREGLGPAMFSKALTYRHQVLHSQELKTGAC